MTQTTDKKTIVGAIHPDVLTFTEGKDPILDLALAQVDCIGTAAHVTMLSKMPYEPQIFTEADRIAVIRALKEIIALADKGEFTITAEDQDVHLAVERQLTERLGDLGRKVHTGRSRNDQVAVDIRLHARNEMIALTKEIAALARALLVFAEANKDIPMVGRTHMQPAMPSSVGMWASAYAEMLMDDTYMLEAARRLTDCCPLGSAAGYGVPLPIDRLLTSKLLAFRRPHHNVFHASNSRGKDEAVILSALSQIMLTLSRMAEDLIIFSTPEFGYFTLPRELCTGSSIMPQKYNPDVLELIRAKAALVMGYSTAANAIIKALPGGYNRDLQDTKELYMEGLKVTRTSIRIMTLMATSITVNSKQLHAGFIPGVFATDRALELVAGGMPFRDAYHEVRNNLEALKSMNADEVIARKKHLGGTAGIDYDALNSRAIEIAQAADDDATRIAQAVDKLLAV